MHAMLDIETLGTKPNSAVLSAGVVFFDPKTGTTHEQKMFLFDPKQQPNRPVDFTTMKWWMMQTQAAREHWYKAKFENIHKELVEFVNFCKTHKSLTWWGCSPAFDQIIMESLLESRGVKVPWIFWKWRDVRTIKDFLKDKSAVNSNAHDPVADCHAQIILVNRFYQEQGLTQ